LGKETLRCPRQATMTSNIANLSIRAPSSISKNFKRVTTPRIRKIVASRQQGLWVAEDTRDDLFHILTEDVENTDVAITMNRGACAFSKLDMSELISEIKHWKSLGMVSDKENINEFEFAGKTYYTWVIQDPKWNDDDAPMCPLICVTGIMVSGFTYFTARRKVAEWVCDQLKVKSMDDKWRENMAKKSRKCDCDHCSDSHASGREPVPSDCELYEDIANGL
jgi:hypothetical protein